MKLGITKNYQNRGVRNVFLAASVLASGLAIAEEARADELSKSNTANITSINPNSNCLSADVFCNELARKLSQKELGEMMQKADWDQHISRMSIRRLGGLILGLGICGIPFFMFVNEREKTLELLQRNNQKFRERERNGYSDVT